MRWLKAVISPGGLWAVGLLRNHGVTVTRATFDGRLQRTSWDDRLDLGQCRPADMLLSTYKANSERVFLSAIGASPLSERTLSRDDCFAREAVIGTPSWLKSPVLASAYDANGVLWVVRDTPTGALISGHLPNGQIVTNFPAPVASELPLPGMGTICLAVIGPQLVCAVGNKLHRFGSSMDSIQAFPSSEIEFDEPIFGLQPGPRWGTQCALVKLESQIGLCWFTSQGTRSYVYDQVGHEAATGFTSDGLIVAITGEGGLIFAADSRGKLRSARFPWKEPIPLAIGCGSGAGTFCSMSAEGQVQIFGFSQSELRPAGIMG